MSNRTALITGAARRIGAAITREVHAMGMDVVIHFNSSRQDAQRLADDLNNVRPASAYTLQTDLSDPDCAALIQKTLGINGRLDVLINNAAVFYPTALASITPAHWDEMMNVNLRAPLLLSRAAAPHLAKHQGCIINLSDIHAERPLRDHTLYSTSKAGLNMLTRSLAKELGPAVRVNAISLGAILWPENLDDNERNTILGSTVLKRQGRPEDIAKAVRYLIDDALYTTGQVLIIDGGRTLFS